MNKLGELIRLKRKEMGLNQKEFGNLFGASQTTVSDWERGIISMMRNWKKLAKALDVSESDFLEMMSEANAESDKGKRLPAPLKILNATAFATAAPGEITAAPTRRLALEMFQSLVVPREGMEVSSSSMGRLWAGFSVPRI